MNFNDLTEEQQNLFNDLKLGVERSVKIVGPKIDELSLKGLRRVLKVVSHLHEGEHILHNKVTKLHEDEQKVIDGIFAAQEKIMLFMALMKELNDEYNPPKKGDNNEQRMD